MANGTLTDFAYYLYRAFRDARAMIAFALAWYCIGVQTVINEVWLTVPIVAFLMLFIYWHPRRNT